jgi:hypothetical protein
MADQARPRVLSLGAGVQSSVLLLMSCRGVLPRLDHAVFADTGWEPAGVYAHLDWLRGEAEAAGIPLHVVRRPGPGLRWPRASGPVGTREKSNFIRKQKQKRQENTNKVIQ